MMNTKTTIPLPNILIVDDHPIVRRGILALLGGVANASIAEAANGSETMRTLQTASIDIAIIDIELPDINGLQLINNIKTMPHAPRIVVYTMHEEPWTIDELMRADVDAIVLKGDDPYELCIAVESVKIGMRYSSARFGQAMGRQNRQLTEREKEVLGMMCDGLSSRQMAERMFVSENTVEYHRKQIMRRIGAKNNAQAVSIAMKTGLIPTFV